MTGSAARTNLTSQQVKINSNHVLGTGAFRIAYAGTYIGGNRNQQEAVCKTFKTKYQVLENEFYAHDFAIADRAIQFAEEWNAMCEDDEIILMTKGDVMEIGGDRYLVEPLIRYFHKYTSNNGWIEDSDGWELKCLEAFSHYTYHRSGGSMIVCDLQGRYRHPTRYGGKVRFELTDPAICSRSHRYGPTDMGEKGIESFFANHSCNNFCHQDGSRWARPRAPKRWFEASEGTSMMDSSFSHLLTLRNNTRFTSTLQPIYDDDSDDSGGW